MSAVDRPSECWRTITVADSGSSVQVPICGARCFYGGKSMARKHSKSDLGWMWHCNRRVARAGQRCWQHKTAV